MSPSFEILSPPAPVLDPAPAPIGRLGLLDRVLRDPRALSTDIQQGREVEALLPGLLLVTAGGAALYGVAVGLQGGLLQALVSAIKLPLILLGGAAVSLPVLHVACALSGLRLRFQQLSALVLQALATAAVTMAGLAPLITVWWLTVSADGGSPWAIYRRVVLVAVGVAGIGGLLGAVRLLRVIPLRAALPWAGVLGLSMLQVAWLSRPLVGMPDQQVALLRPLESNALTELLSALWAVLS